ncbi:hypothetical protein D9611_003847 [Ephemerocybe angulata]|uniref:GB1/RHD3-type G domain-containing protein n=1 Tax=Ephemerocybe angulata TaxID=980116 RepID=A0A8H5B7R6_9AGAR|nr:hypothetical protein D9611_003847 [Tulosesus angulatus]
MASAQGINGHAQQTVQASTNASTERVQVVNEDKTFTSELSGQIERWGLRDSGFNYNIVAVFGSQSTGKSTLLNRLFGTTFDVMDETRRQQTTKGIWMCRGKDMSAMVMDVEGTDGRERGEDQASASSHTSIELSLIVPPGLREEIRPFLPRFVRSTYCEYVGASSRSRTLLLFVIRDHVGATPLANLQATLIADLNRIWDTLSKPDELKDRQLSDYFDLAFTTLPHKILVPDKFEADVKTLRKRFTDKSDPGYVFKPQYHKRIPADGVAMYMSNIWEQVQTNKDLDLPTQQELLAQFRCDEISAGALAEFNEQAKSQKRPIESGRVVEGLGALMKNWRTQALTRYDRDASRYHKGVYTRKRGDLISVIDSTLSPLFLGQLKNAHKSCLVTFKKELLDGLKGDDYSFGDVVTKATKNCEETFTSVAKEALIEDTDWNWEEELEVIKEETRGIADQCRKDETKKMINQIERNVKKLISEPVEIQLSKPSTVMWDGVLKTFKEVLAKAEATYLAKAKSFNCTEEENTAALAALRKRSWIVLRGKIEEQTADQVLLGKLRGHFEEQFRYDEQGVPRVWKPEDDIDGAFVKAKEQTLELVPLYSRIKPSDPSLEFILDDDSSDDLANEEFEFASSLVVLSETKSLDLINKFRKDADAYFVEAKRSTVSSIAQIPYWMYGVLVVLGWNEAMAVLFNPLYFTFLLVGAAAAYMIIQLGLTGPLLQVTKTVAGEVQRQATVKLREALAQPVEAQPVRASRSRESSYYEEDSDRPRSISDLAEK